MLEQESAAQAATGMGATADASGGSAVVIGVIIIGCILLVIIVIAFAYWYRTKDDKEGLITSSKESYKSAVSQESTTAAVTELGSGAIDAVIPKPSVGGAEVYDVEVEVVPKS